MDSQESNNREADIAHALVAFVDGSKLHGKGLFLEDGKIQNEGLDKLRAAAELIERHTGSYDLLLPLLKHSDPIVRMNAAAKLINDHFETILPVLHEMDENCVTEAGQGAGLYLQMYGQPNLGSGFKKPQFTEMVPKPRMRR